MLMVVHCGAVISMSWSFIREAVSYPKDSGPTATERSFEANSLFNMEAT